MENNNFYFDGRYYHQLEGTGMGVDFAGNYACLSIGYLEKVRLFEHLLVPHFKPDEIELIMRAFLRYVDDGFMFWPVFLNVTTFINLLDQLDPTGHIKYTVVRGIIENGAQTNVFMDIKVILHHHRLVETELHYKATNNHHYLEYDSFHAKHVKNNIPFNFFKKIIVFTSDVQKERVEIEKMKTWLYKCGYPKYIIDKGLHNARLQGPAPAPSSKKDIIPFVTQNCSNYSCSAVVKKLKLLVEKCPDQSTREFFETKDIVQAVRQPPSILRQLTTAKFDSEKIHQKRVGTFKCSHEGCKICKLYLEECDTVTGNNGVIWRINSHITCHSRFVLYFLTCLGCNQESKVGKTNHMRPRINNHISEAKNGNTTDIFDKHVFACKKDHIEPVFKLNVLMEVDNYDKLLVYEDYFHKQGFDTMNRKKAAANV